MTTALKQIIAILIIALFMGNSYAAEDYSTRGKEFWLSFYAQQREDESLESRDLFVLIACENDCNGTITSVDGSFQIHFNVSAGEVTKVPIPVSVALAYSSYDTVCVTPRGLYVETSDTTSVYIGNYEQYSYDASVVLPVTSLSDEYIAATYHATDVSAVLAIAIEDATTIQFTPSNPISFTDPSGTEIIYDRGVTYERTLNKGECLLLAASSLMGTDVKAKDCKKIAVFSGNYCPYVPDDCPACDLLVEQVPPLLAWGKKFIVVPTLERERDSRIVILPSVNDTRLTLYRNGSSQELTFSRGQYVEIELSTQDAFISANLPVSVTQYAIGSMCSGSGDPMMIWINPVEQSVTNAIFTPCPSPQITNHYALVVTESAHAAMTTLDGINVGNLFSTCTQNSDYAFARIPVEVGTHHLKNKDGMMVYAYGYAGGEAGQKFESYGYYCGARQRNVRDNFDVENGKSDFLPDEDVNLTVTIGSDDVKEVRTFINDIDVTSLLPHVTTLPGTQTLTIPNDMLRVGDNDIRMTFIRRCQTTQSQTSVCQDYTTSQEATICYGAAYEFEGQLLTESGEYYAIVTKQDGCDTLKTLSLTVRDENVVYQTVYLMWGDTCWIDGKAYTKTGTYINHFQDQYGCDSTLYTTIIRKHTNCPDIRIPAFFSPNGDGENDCWIVENIACYEGAAIRIFDRYAKLLATLSSEDALTQGWNGRYNGQDLPSTTYWYEITLPEVSRQLVGYFLLKR